MTGVNVQEAEALCTIKSSHTARHPALLLSSKALPNVLLHFVTDLFNLEWNLGLGNVTENQLFPPRQARGKMLDELNFPSHCKCFRHATGTRWRLR